MSVTKIIIFLIVLFVIKTIYYLTSDFWDLLFEGLGILFQIAWVIVKLGLTIAVVVWVWKLSDEWWLSLIAEYIAVNLLNNLFWDDDEKRKTLLDRISEWFL